MQANKEVLYVGRLQFNKGCFDLAKAVVPLLKADSELTEIRVSAKGIIDDAKERGEVERAKIVKNAKGEAVIVLENAQREIDSEIEKARTSINDEIVSVAVLMAEKVIKKEIDESKHKELLAEVNKEVIS